MNRWFSKFFRTWQKFDCALKLFNAYENAFGNNSKVNRLISNQYLYLNIQKFLNSPGPASSRPKHVSKYLSQENILKNCKTFLINYKNEQGNRKAQLVVLRIFCKFTILRDPSRDTGISVVIFIDRGRIQLHFIKRAQFNNVYSSKKEPNSFPKPGLLSV